MERFLAPEDISSDRKFVWCLGSSRRFPGDADESDRYYLPAYALFMARPGIDIIVVPGDTATMHEVADFCKLFGIEEWQIVFTEGRVYELERDLYNSKSALNTIRKTMTRRGGEWVIVPWANGSRTQRIASELGIPIFGDDRAWVKQVGTKGILYPRPNQPEPFTFPQQIRVVRGFRATTVEELLAAHRMLSEQGIKRFVLKPELGDGGTGIEMFDGKVMPNFFQTYRFPMGPVVLEEGIHLAKNNDGDAITCSMHVCNGTIGPLCGQAVFGHTYCGNYAPYCSLELEAQAYEMVAAYVAWSGIKWGGIDFLLDRDGTLYFNDVNGGRMTEAYPLHFFGKRFAPEGAYIASCKFNPSLPISEWWGELHSREIAHSLDGRGYGLAPICYAQNNAMVAISARSAGHADELFEAAADLLPLG